MTGTETKTMREDESDLPRNSGSSGSDESLEVNK